ncbi:SRPBCC family protein [Dactylosporangium cerinum]
MRTSTCSLYIAADPARVWRAITDPGFTRRFYLGLAVESQWIPGAPIVYRAAAGPVPDVLHGDIVHVEEGGCWCTTCTPASASNKKCTAG